MQNLKFSIQYTKNENYFTHLLYIKHKHLIIGAKSSILINKYRKTLNFL